MTTPDSTSLTIRRELSASPDEVFEAWLDAESLAVWMCPGSVRSAEAEVDPRVGGRFRIVMKGPDCDYEHTGEYLVLERPHRLAFTWISPETRQVVTTVSVEIRGLGPGRSELTLTHVGLPDEKALRNHRAGWGDILEKLGLWAEADRSRPN